MKIVDAAEMRRVEAAAIGTGISGLQLMRRAGAAAAELVAARMRRFGFSRIVFLCGGGNNGGDALAAAALLADKFPVAIWLLRPFDALHGEAAEVAAVLPEEVKALATTDFFAVDPHDGDLVVDGLLGIGLSGEVRQPTAELIHTINARHLPVIALDVPSGMDSDTGEGRCSGKEALYAFNTITFGFPKRGLFTPCGIAFSGTLYVADIGLKSFVPPVSCGAFTDLEAMDELPRFACDIHKNRRGQLLVAAGSRRYPGAAELAVTAGLCGGAGLIRAFTPAGISVRLPSAAIPVELAATGAGSFAAAPNWTDFSGASALVAGPGWGDEVPAEVLTGMLDFPGSIILDADALNLLARHPELWRSNGRTVLTPHPGEAERLRRAFGVAESNDRAKLAAALAKRLDAVVLLKGARTVVADRNGDCTINISGSPDLATAGSGDVLAGLIGALLANGTAPETAARLGALIHGRAGEALGRGAMADDIPRAIAAVTAKLEKRLFL